MGRLRRSSPPMLRLPVDAPSGPPVVIVEVSVAPEVGSGYLPAHVDFQVRRLSRRRTLRRMLDGLRGSHALLTDGRHVETPCDAFRWVLDQVSEQIGDCGLVQ